MHDEVGIAADRRGEVRVAAQVEAEMAEILRRIFRLRLAAQHDFVDQPFDVAALYARQDAIERIRPQRAALGQRNVERRQKLPQRIDLFRRRLVVHAIDQRDARALAGFGGGHVGEDHELLDQPVRFQPLRDDHAIDRAVGFEHDLALGNFEIERARARRGRGAPRDMRRKADREFFSRSARSPHRAGRKPRAAPARNAAARRSGSARGETCASACGRRRRSPCAPRAPGGPRPAAASTDRWRCARAASARRGRESRPSCRARPPRDRAPSPAARSAPRRRWRR